jgi:pimeloyl-ACP methyl ester carboxylesterase
MQTPRTHYAKSDSVNVAYQVVGDGARTIVCAPGWVTHVEILWEDPGWVRMMQGLAAFARVIVFDKRGTGASDRDVGYPTLDDRMDDIRAVMDAVGVERAALFGWSEGGNMACTFAAAHPERTSHLVLFGVFAKRVPSPDYPWAPSPEARRRWIDAVERHWGEGVDIDVIAPSRVGDRAFRDWWNRLERMAASPGAARKIALLNSDIDLRAVLPAVRAPTLVMRRRGDRDVRVEEGRYVAACIPGARFVELEGEDHLLWSQGVDAVVAEIAQFVAGEREAAPVDTALATILCTDIVDSTARRAAAGDAAWHALMGRHDAAVREILRRRQGVEINTTGDGFLASFSSPGRAIAAAVEIGDAAKALGVPVRAGVHTGECARRDGAFTGIAIDIAVRIAALAGGGEVVASRTVRDLTIGAGFDFSSRGEHALKGAPGAWEVFAVSPRSGV